jgi:hypothetical protein
MAKMPDATCLRSCAVEVDLAGISFILMLKKTT